RDTETQRHRDTETQRHRDTERGFKKELKIKRGYYDGRAELRFCGKWVKSPLSSSNNPNRSVARRSDNIDIPETIALENSSMGGSGDRHYSQVVPVLALVLSL
ncbi:MAG TPA: hypothetical protein PL124_09575, partial [Candidatus Cloacimonadota bacterium]|nr:hypothetical protein [Candidatus Cloacimonadota bacterium]